MTNERLFLTDADRPRHPRLGRIIVHAKQFHSDIKKTCRNLDHAKLVAANWDYLKDQSVQEEEIYGMAISFAAVERITDVEGFDLMSRREVGELWLTL